MEGLLADIAIVLASTEADFAGATAGLGVIEGMPAPTAAVAAALVTNPAGVEAVEKAAGTVTAAGVTTDGTGPLGRGVLPATPGGTGRPASWKSIASVIDPSRSPSTARLHFSTSAGCPRIVTRAFSSDGLCWSTKQCAFEKVLIALMVDACFPMRSPTELCEISRWADWFWPLPAAGPAVAAGAGGAEALAPPALAPDGPPKET
mmetsp:Transcript_57710/g.163916  ORF Transcript_57710/g.163916 Transcript_57710/m.163916 type:complete len:205 (+) Transcript_57710:1439-2053(+)